jgi:hypothetical protein
VGNNVTLIPKKPERHSLLTSTEDVVYMPLGSKDSHGILQVGDNLVVDKGVVSLDLNGDWYQKVVEALELSKSEILILDADGVQTSSGVEFTIKNHEDFEKYKTDKRRFLIKMKLPVLNNIDKDNKVLIHFGSKRYLVFSFVKGMNSQLTLKDLQAVVRKDTDGYSYFANFIYLDSPEFNGFILDPAASAGTVTGLKPDGVTIGINKNGDLNAIALDDGFISVDDKINFDDFKGFVHLTHEQYNRLKTYGEIEIDGKVLKYDDSLVYITPDVAVPSNPNLLINGDFRINQRGKTEYNYILGQGRIYSVDRWVLWAGNAGTFNVDTKTLTAASGTGNVIFSQYVEDTNALLGKTLTMSAKIDGKVYSITGTVPQQIGTSDTIVGLYENKPSGVIIWYIRILLEKQRGFLRIDVGCAHGNSLTIDYAKLEIGSIATAFSPRPYAEELAMCLRYYQNLRVDNAQYLANPSVMYPNINLLAPLRKNPTVEIETQPSVRGNGSIVGNIDNAEFGGKRDNILLLTCDVSNLSLIQGQIYMVTNGVIYVDAEI